jgi:DNA-binding MarR family transcriptional regulator
MSKKRKSELTVREMGRLGGRAQHRKYSKEQLRAWCALGGAKPKLSQQDAERAAAMRKAGKSLRECAEEFGVDPRAITRALARLRKQGEMESEG